jgi:hypothetical protein
VSSDLIEPVMESSAFGVEQEKLSIDLVFEDWEYTH